jgi:peptidoglycan-associated lipoprotein
MRSAHVIALSAVALMACAHSKPEPAAAPAPQAALPAPPPVAPPPPAQPAPEPQQPRKAPDVQPASIYFGFDASDLTPESRTTLQAIFESAQTRPDTNIRIEGNCDERGTREYNLALGQRRADAAKNYLVRLGLDPSRISTVSNGEERPRASGHDPDSWRENRRDDLVPAAEAIGRAERR